MSELFASGRIVDVVLALVALEALVLLMLWRRRGRGIEPVGLLTNLAAGAALMAAVRSALVGADWRWTAGCLAVAGIAHVADLLRRWH